MLRSELRRLEGAGRRSAVVPCLTRSKMRVLPALAILGTAYAAEQTTDGLVQVGKMHRPCAS